jgi:hypothetical protein
VVFKPETVQKRGSTRIQSPRDSADSHGREIGRSDFPREHQLSDQLITNWKKQFLENADTVFAQAREASDEQERIPQTRMNDWPAEGGRVNSANAANRRDGVSVKQFRSSREKTIRSLGSFGASLSPGLT